jgi:hypothetical protein
MRRNWASVGTLRGMTIERRYHCDVCRFLSHTLAALAIGNPPEEDRSCGMAKVYIGTSGWTYDGWRGPFYPEDTPKRAWVDDYAHRIAPAR